MLAPFYPFAGPTQVGCLTHSGLSICKLAVGAALAGQRRELDKGNASVLGKGSKQLDHL